MGDAWCAIVFGPDHGHEIMNRSVGSFPHCRPPSKVLLARLHTAHPHVTPSRRPFESKALHRRFFTSDDSQTGGSTCPS